MSYVSNKIFADFDKYVLKVMYESNEIIDMMNETIEVKDGIINDLTEQVAYWTNLYRELNKGNVMPVAIRPARKRVGGRTEKDTQVVSVRLSSDLVAQLDAVASATGASRTSLLEALMRTRQTLDALSNETKEARIIILTERNNDLTEQVAYWTNLYRELKNAEGETK